MQPGCLAFGLIAANFSAHPAGPPFSRRNRLRSVHAFRSRQAYRKALGPAALGLVVGGRGRVDDHSDKVAALLGAELEQLCDDSGGLFCLLCSPQLNVELEHGYQIVVEREPAS
jgi:hypothetical protein